MVDSETKAKIAAYIYDKDTGGILGQVTKDTPLQLTGDVNASRILRFVSSGYIEVEQLVTYAIPTAEVTVEMDKVPVQSGTIYATAVNTESTALDGVTFEYKLSTESDWKPLNNDESTAGKSEAVTAPVGTSVDFRASKTGYITNTGTGTINSTGEHSVTIVLEEVPPEPTTKQYYIHAVTEESVNITTGVHGYLWNNNSWVEQTLQGGAMGFAYTGEPGTSIRVKFTATRYNDTEKILF